jgi:hypothetical protein
MNRFCIITPIFDGAAKATNLLIQDLQQQSYKNYCHVLISNGPSPEIKSLATIDERILYVELPQEDTTLPTNLSINIGKRRHHCIKNIEAIRYFFFDADLKITDIKFLEKIKEIHEQADVILARIEYKEKFLPIKPYSKGRIDIANYSFSSHIAKKYNYPTEPGMANDFRFYDSMRNEKHYLKVLPVYATKDGRPLYKTVSTLHKEKAAL